ncbi:hypothetical protein AOQ84DRAFT_381347, partial [Glonium stellatum]
MVTPPNDLRARKGIKPCAAPTNGLNATDSLPTYTPPTTGILSYLPSSWVPYGELM